MRAISKEITKVFPEFDLLRTLVDMDGVLCVDFFGEEPETCDFNDPDDQWAAHLKGARSLWIPEMPVLGIVTARLRKYQQVTEQWLIKHSVQCRWMMMSTCESPAKRRRFDIGYWKAQVYLDHKDASLFVESDRGQAQTIAAISGKPVYSMRDRALFIIRVSPPDAAPAGTRSASRLEFPDEIVGTVQPNVMSVGYVADLEQWGLCDLLEEKLEPVEDTDVGGMEDIPVGQVRPGKVRDRNGPPGALPRPAQSDRPPPEDGQGN